MVESPPARPASVIIARWLLLLPAGVFTGLTVATHVGRILDVSFRLYAAGAAAASLLALIVWLVCARRDLRQIERRDLGVLAGLLALGLAGAVLASIYHLPDTDDYSYVPDAVHYMTYPDDIMGYELRYIYPGSSGTIRAVVVSTSQPFEYAQMLLALLLRMEYMAVYYILTVALVGFSIPLALYLLLSHFSDNSRDTLLATILAVAVLTLMGETKYTFGSLSFTRVFQGKVVLFAAGLPLLAAVSLDALRGPSWMRHGVVFAVAAAQSGLSSTGFVLVPMLGLALGLAHWLAAGPGLRRLAQTAAYGAALVYPVAYGLYAARTVGSYQDASNPLLHSWPQDFAAHLRLLIDPARPVTPLVFGLSLLLIALLLRGFRRRLLLFWVGASVALFLNPLTAPFWIEHTLGPVIYWRAFLILPLPAMAGAAAMALLERVPGTPSTARPAVAALAALALAAVHFVPGAPSIYRWAGQISPPRYNVPRVPLAVARQIAEHAPPGPMLAPQEVAGVIGLLRGGFPQLHLRRDPMRDVMPWHEAEARWAAAHFADGDAAYEAEFRQVLSEIDDLRIVVLRTDMIPSVADELGRLGFEPQIVQDRYTIFWR